MRNVVVAEGCLRKETALNIRQRDRCNNTILIRPQRLP